VGWLARTGVRIVRFVRASLSHRAGDSAWAARAAARRSSPVGTQFERKDFRGDCERVNSRGHAHRLGGFALAAS